MVYNTSMKKSSRKSKKTSHGTQAYSSGEMKRYLGALAETHNEHLKGIKEGFNVINNKLDGHTEMIGSLMENMEIVKEDVSTIKRDLKKKVDYDEFISLVRRVQKIESKI